MAGSLPAIAVMSEYPAASVLPPNKYADYLYGIDLRNRFRSVAGIVYSNRIAAQRKFLGGKANSTNGRRAAVARVRIKDIAEQLGYDQLYFSTVFHRITGEYPKHYREQLEQRAKDGQA